MSRWRCEGGAEAYLLNPTPYAVAHCTFRRPPRQIFNHVTYHHTTFRINPFFSPRLVSCAPFDFDCGVLQAHSPA